MFDMEHLWKILRYIKDDKFDIELSQLTQALGKHEQNVAKKFFKSNLDQPAFATDDYKRLRNLLIDWYSSLRTITTTQRNSITDVFSIPDNQLSELFRSFGYGTGLDIVPLSNKSHFFLDLVNFYKKKGTPEVIIDVLDYYGFSDADLVEYWLLKDNLGNLVFRPESTRRSSIETTEDLLIDLSFNSVTSTDPHWLYTKQQIENLIATNKINLPSKTSYFSLASNYKLLKLSSALAILSKVIHNEYARFDSGLELSKIVPVRRVGISTSILAIFTAFTYSFNKFLNPNSNFQGNETFTYDKDLTYSNNNPPIVSNLSLLTEEYVNLIKRPTSRDEKDANIITLNNEWGQSKSLHYLSTTNAETLLIALDPELKDVIDGYFLRQDESTIILHILNSLDIWLRTNISTDIPSLLVSVLGFAFKEEVVDIINFFKPFRARLLALEGAFVIDNPLTESVIPDDYLAYVQTEFITDPEIVVDNNHLEIYFEDTIYDEHLCCFEENYTGESHVTFDSNFEFDCQYLTERIFQVDITETRIEPVPVTDELTETNITQQLYDWVIAQRENGDLRTLYDDGFFHDTGSAIDTDPIVLAIDTYSEQLWSGQYDTMDNDHTFDGQLGHEEFNELITDSNYEILSITDNPINVVQELIHDYTLDSGEERLYDHSIHDSSIAYDGQFFIDMILNVGVDEWRFSQGDYDSGNHDSPWERILTVLTEYNIDSLTFLSSLGMIKTEMQFSEYSRIDPYHVAKEMYDLDKAFYDDLASADDRCIVTSIDNLYDNTLQQFYGSFDEGKSEFDIPYFHNYLGVDITQLASGIVQTSDSVLHYYSQIIKDNNFSDLDDGSVFDQLSRFEDNVQILGTDIHKDLFHQVSPNVFTEYQMNGPNVAHATQTGGFSEWDGEAVFDSSYGRDVFEVFVSPV